MLYALTKNYRIYIVNVYFYFLDHILILFCFDTKLRGVDVHSIYCNGMRTNGRNREACESYIFYEFISFLFSNYIFNGIHTIRDKFITLTNTFKGSILYLTYSFFYCVSH